MGNCLKCFQFQSTAEQSFPASSSASQVNDCQVATSIGNCRGANTNERCTIYERPRETDELLSTRSPLKPANNCDSNSFKCLGLLNGSAPTMSDIISTAVKESMEVSHEALNKLFDVYKDPDDDDMILTDGIERLCSDLNYQPDEFAILVLAWCLDASQMCRFTKTEFIEGLNKMRADSIQSIRLRLEQTIEMLKADAEMFKQLYRFTFRFGLEPDQRVLSLEMAIDLWKLVFTVQTPDLFSNWIDFLEKHPNIRRIPKDTWNMYLNFTEQCDIENYDDTEAWPSLFDDFVDYERTRAIEMTTINESRVPAKAITANTEEVHCDDSNINIIDNNNDDPLQTQLKSGDPRHVS